MKDDEFNQEIDFSNQPLGLMAQEGAQIEKNVNNEFRLNEAARNNANSQGNPFADVEKPRQDKPELMPSMNQGVSNTPVQNQGQQPQEIINLSNNDPIEHEPIKMDDNVTIGSLNFNESNNMPSMSEEDKKREALLNSIAKDNSSDMEPVTGDQPPIVGLIVVIVLVGFVVAAFILFKTGKIDNLIKTNDTQEVEENTNNNGNDIVLEGIGEPETLTVDYDSLVELRNYKFSESLYLLSEGGIATNMTTEGTVDLVNKVSVAKQKVSIGASTATVDVYTDYANMVGYYEDTNNAGEWIKQKYIGATPNIDDRLQAIAMKSELKLQENKHYTGTVNSFVVFEAFGSSSIPESDVLDVPVTVDLTIDNGRIATLKVDFTGAIKNIKKYKYSLIVSNVNENSNIEIPADVLAKAKAQ